MDQLDKGIVWTIVRIGAISIYRICCVFLYSYIFILEFLGFVKSMGELRIVRLNKLIFRSMAITKHIETIYLVTYNTALIYLSAHIFHNSMFKSYYLSFQNYFESTIC